MTRFDMTFTTRLTGPAILAEALVETLFERGAPVSGPSTLRGLRSHGDVVPFSLGLQPYLDL